MNLSMGVDFNLCYGRTCFLRVIADFAFDLDLLAFEE
jgi:hypothetical protein